MMNLINLIFKEMKRVSFKKMTQVARRLFSSSCATFCVALLLTACTASQQIVPHTVAQSEPALAEKTPPAPPSNATAMQRVAPLAIVEGDLRALSHRPYPAGDFSSAIDYAASMDSYALLVWHKGALRLEHYYGEHDASVKPETASLHKGVLGLLVAAAVEDGFIKSVDDPVGNYISAWETKPEGKITIRHLLTMSSGLKSLSSEGGFNSPAMQFFFGRLDARKTVLNLRLDAQLNDRFNYANTNSQLLALVLEAATEMPYADYLSERIWQPIGADSAGLWLFEETGFPRTFSSLFARPRDWLKVGLLIKNQGVSQGRAVLQSSTISDITLSSKNNPNYGWQMWLGREYQAKRYYNDAKVGIAIPASEPFAVNDMIYFDGFGGQRVYISESADLVIVRVGDSRLDWDDSRLPNMIIKGLKD